MLVKSNEELIKIREELDEKVKEYTANNLQAKGIVTGWVIGIATARFLDDGDASYQVKYSCSPDTDMVRAVGIVDLVKDLLHDDIVHPRGDDDEEDS